MKFFKRIFYVILLGYIVSLTFQLYSYQTDVLSPQSFLNSVTDNTSQYMELVNPGEIFKKTGDIELSEGELHKLIQKHVQSKFKIRALVTKDSFRAWLDLFLDNRDVVRIFKFSNTTDLKETFQIPNAEWEFKKGKHVFQIDKNKNTNPVMGGKLGFISDKDYERLKNKKQVGSEESEFIWIDDSNHFLIYKAKLIHSIRYHLRKIKDPKERRKEKEFFESTIKYLHEKWEKGLNVESIERSFRIAEKMAQYGEKSSSILASLLIYEGIEDFDFRELLEKHQLFKNINNETTLYKSKNLIHELKRAKLLRNMHFDESVKPENKKFERYGFQNYLHTIISLSADKGDVNPDISLLALIMQLEELKDNKDLQGEELLKTLEQVIPLSDRFFSLKEISDEYREIRLKRTAPEASGFIKNAIKNKMGVSYEDLPEILDHPVTGIKKQLETILYNAGIRGFKIYSRVKTLDSLWEKINKEYEKHEKENPTEKKSMEEFIINSIGGIYDILGVQVIFDFNEQIRNQEVLESIQKNIIHEISKALRKNTDKEFEERGKSLGYGYSERKIRGLVKHNAKNMPIEIQVLSDIDYQIYRHGGEMAHWIYKLKKKGYKFDDDFLNKIKDQMTGDFHNDFRIIAHEINKFNYVAVIVDEDGEKNIRYRRLPRNAIAADAVSARNIDLLGTKMYAVDKLNYNDMGELNIEYKEINMDEKLYPGQILYVNKTEIVMNAKSWDNVMQNAQKVRTVLLALLKKNKVQDKTIFEDTTLEEFTKLGRSELQKIVNKGIEIFRLKDKEEFFLLMELIATLDFKYSEFKQRTVFEKNECTAAFKGLLNQFFSEHLEMQDAASSLEKFYEEQKKSEYSPMELIFMFLEAETKGQKIAMKILKNLGHRKLKGDKILEEKYKYIFKQLGIENSRQLYFRLGLGLNTYSEVLMHFHLADKIIYRLHFEPEYSSDQVKEWTRTILSDINKSEDWVINTQSNVLRIAERFKLIPQKLLSCSVFIPENDKDNILRLIQNGFRTLANAEGINEPYLVKQHRTQKIKISFNVENVKEAEKVEAELSGFFGKYGLKISKNSNIYNMFEAEMPYKLNVGYFKKNILLPELKDKLLMENIKIHIQAVSDWSPEVEIQAAA